MFSLSVSRPPQDCPQQAAKLIHRCLENDPALRPTARELVLRLQQLTGQEP